MSANPASALSGPNAPFIEELYARYLEHPEQVDPSWRKFFSELQDESDLALNDIRGASWAPRSRSVEIAREDGNGHDYAYADDAAPVRSARPQDLKRAARDSLRVMMLIRAYRVRGHLEASLDPLQLKPREKHADLDPRTYGFTEADMDREIHIDNILGYESANLRQIVYVLRQTYCGNIGVEYMHIQNPDQRKWLQLRIEGSRNQREFTDRGKRAVLERLTAAEMFEKFLDKKYTGTKRFGLDGGETMIPALEQIIKRGSQLGLKEVVVGMAHRGRLNMLANFMNKPFSAIFSEFQGNAANPEDVQGSADVKYHLGTSADREFDGRVVHLSLTANPSHLEAVNTVVQGKVRAKQRQRNDKSQEEVMGLLLHGDAAFAGQGLVPESLDMSELDGYKTGGTIHFIINNQIGFTTTPDRRRARAHYCTDVAKMRPGPDFPRQRAKTRRRTSGMARAGRGVPSGPFNRDVVIDLVCYRRFGHNESDEPGVHAAAHVQDPSAPHPSHASDLRGASFGARGQFHRATMATGGRREASRRS